MHDRHNDHDRHKDAGHLPNFDEYLSDFSMSVYDASVAEIRRLVPSLDLTRMIFLYVRQSDPTNRNVHYRKAQEDTLQVLLDAGIPRDLIRVFSEDDGKSAWLNEEYRSDYRAILAGIEAGECGTLVAQEISRLHRDYTDVQAATMATRMGWKGARVLTKDDGRWQVLDMAKDADKENYKNLAKRAAAERKKFRDISTTARMQGKRDGYASGGGVCPIGWRTKPGLSKFESPDGVRKFPTNVIYGAHARVRLAAMRESLLPHIETLPDLARHLSERGFIVPPFEEDVRSQAFPRSSLVRVYRKTPSGQRVYLKMDESYSSFQKEFLLSLLIDPMVIGDVRHGSGRSGKYAILKARSTANGMKQESDSRILPGRVLVHTNRALALCRSEEFPDFPEYDELYALWERVVRKWAPVDMIAARANNYRSEPVNPHRVNRAGRKEESAPLHSVNEWSGFARCGHHDGELGYTLRLGVHGPTHREQWQCHAFAQAVPRSEPCVTWSGPDLRAILNAHLKRRLHLLANSDEPLFRDIFERRRNAEREHASLGAELAEAEAEMKRLNTKYDRIDTRFDPATPEAEREVVLGPILADITRVTAQVYALRAKAAEAAHEADASGEGETEAELRTALAKAYETYDGLEIPRKRHLIALLVEHVVVMVGDGVTAPECLIAFTWKNGQTDHLVGWREAQDTRPWTAEEDAALRELWPSGCDYRELKAALLPGRRYHAIRERALAIRNWGRAKQRPTGWKEKAWESEKTWHERNPDVLYLLLSGDEDDAGEPMGAFNAPYCKTFRVGDSPTRFPRYVQSTPPEVLRGVTLTTARCSYLAANF